MSATILMWLFVLGGTVGVLAGLMGIGGGMIMVPFLVTAFAREGYPQDALIKMAIGTSLATIIFTSVSSIVTHHRLGGVRWPVVRALTPGIMVGALIGTQIVEHTPATIMMIGFSLFLLWSAWRLARRAPASPLIVNAPDPSGLRLAGVGSGIGLLSSLVGAGGGFMTIPWLISKGMLPSRAIGSSAACGLPIALAGSIGYMLAGREFNLLGPVIGFIHLPALFAIAAASVLSAPFGARLAHRLPAQTMRRLLAAMLTILAIYTLGHL